MPQIKEKIKDNYMPALKFGALFWPAAQLINFRYVGPTYRVLYISLAGLIWNTFVRYALPASHGEGVGQLLSHYT